MKKFILVLAVEAGDDESSASIGETMEKLVSRGTSWETLDLQVLTLDDAESTLADMRSEVVMRA